MKIYIKNYNIHDLTEKTHLLKKYYNNSKKIIFIYSNEGVFQINDNTIMKMNIVKDKINKMSNGIIVDESEIVYEKHTHIPFEHVFQNTIQHIYKISPSSKLKLVIEENPETFVPIDFYFETNIEDKIYNPIIKDDLNVFLSLLN